MSNRQYRKPILDNIPDELKQHDQWVTWKAISDNGKIKKVPFNPKTGSKASVSLPATWGDYDTAVAAYEKGGYDGIGFVLTKDDSFFAFDFDKCLNPEKRTIEKRVSKIIARLNTYTEISPSGKGIRGFGIGKLPPEGCKSGNIEFYDAGRYVTVTGRNLGQYPAIQNCQEAVEAVHAEIFNQTAVATSILPPEDQNILEKAFASKNGPAIRDLYLAVSNKDSDASAADLAFCNHLAFWFGCDAKRMDRVFRSSRRYRDKWDVIHSSDGRTYGEMTIQTAIDDEDNTYWGNDYYIDELNEDHACVRVSGKACIINEDFNPVLKREEITFSSINNFKNHYLNKRVGNSNDSNTPTVAEVWLKSTDRREYEGVIFNPGGDIEGYYNLYKGLAVEPKKGNWELYKEHIYNIIVKQNQTIYDWVLAWMARIVQNPGGERPGTCIVLQGGQGAGKGVFATMYGKIFGRYFLHLINQTRLIGRFNSHFVGAVLVFCDEGFMAKDQSALGVIKGMITEDQIMIEPKNINAFPIKNFTNLIIASNSERIINATLDERRFLVLPISDERAQDTTYFEPILMQMKDNGGVEAMLYDLLRWDISKVNLRQVPKTEGLANQKIESFDSVQTFWFECLCQGSLSAKGTEWPRKIATQILYCEYMSMCKSLYSKDKVPCNVFVKKLKRLCPALDRQRNREGDQSRRYYLSMPSLEECRKEFEKQTRIKIDWDKN